MDIGCSRGWRAHFPTRLFRREPARDALRKSLTAENLKQEAAYLRGKGRANFERPYGLGWLLQLCAELREWDDPQARELSANLRPLEEVAVERLSRLAAETVPSGSHRGARRKRRSRSD